MAKRNVAICVAFMFILGLAFGASAAWRHGSTPWRAGFGIRGRFNLVEALDLAEDQVAKLKEIQKDFYEKTKPLRNELQDILFELGQLRLARVPDRAAVEAKMDQAAKLRKQICKLREDYRQQVESVLTREQLEKMKTAWRKARYGRRPVRMGPRGWWF